MSRFIFNIFKSWYLMCYVLIKKWKYEHNRDQLLKGVMLCNLQRQSIYTTANMRNGSDVKLMLGQHLRRWPNINPTYDQCLVFAGTLSAILLWEIYE